MKALKAIWKCIPHSKVLIYSGLIALGFIICLNELQSQSGNIVWQTQIGGTGLDEIYRTIENNKNLLIAAGVTRSFDSKGEDIMVSTLSSEGKVIHNWNYGGKANDGAYSIIQTYDGGYLIGGYTQSKWPK